MSPSPIKKNVSYSPQNRSYNEKDMSSPEVGRTLLNTSPDHDHTEFRIYYAQDSINNKRKRIFEAENSNGLLNIFIQLKCTFKIIYYIDNTTTPKRARGSQTALELIQELRARNSQISPSINRIVAELSPLSSPVLSRLPIDQSNLCKFISN